MKVKIIGAGSIGNHLANAARRMNWDVVVVDADQQALARMKETIYPSRYGAWDERIALYTSDQEPKENFDIIMIGTPPNVRMPLAIKAIRERPRILHLEKPLCTPDLLGLDTFSGETKKFPETMVTVGYDHAVSESVQYVVDLLRKNSIGKVLTIDVEFREHWKGIFVAHPWLSGPVDSYLGYWRKGGGAGCEHSHATHLWQYLSEIAGFGEIVLMKSLLRMKKDGILEYDEIASFLFQTEYGGMGRVIQDVVTLPVRKCALIQGENGFIRWRCNGSTEGDTVRFQFGNSEVTEIVFTKKRPDDFYREMVHYEGLLTGDTKYDDSPLALKKGVSVMEILQKAYFN